MNRNDVLELLSKIVSKEQSESIVEVLEQANVLVLGYGDKDVDAIVNTFKRIFGTTKATRYDRYAAKRLAEKYGKDTIIFVIEFLSKNSDKKYAPLIGSVLQLEDKWVSVFRFVKDNMKKEETIDL